MSRLSRRFDRLAEAKVEFELESGGPGAATMARITVRPDGRRHALTHAGQRSHNPQMALQLAADKVDRQMVRLKEKIKLQRHRATPPARTEGR